MWTVTKITTTVSMMVWLAFILSWTRSNVVDLPPGYAYWFAPLFFDWTFSFALLLVAVYALRIWWPLTALTGVKGWVRPQLQSCALIVGITFTMAVIVHILTLGLPGDNQVKDIIQIASFMPVCATFLCMVAYQKYVAGNLSKIRDISNINITYRIRFERNTPFQSIFMTILLLIIMGYLSSTVVIGSGVIASTIYDPLDSVGAFLYSLAMSLAIIAVIWYGIHLWFADWKITEAKSGWVRAQWITIMVIILVIAAPLTLWSAIWLSLLKQWMIIPPLQISLMLGALWAYQRWSDRIYIAGRDRYGWDRAGYDRSGHNVSGFDRDGLHRNGTHYDDNGYSQSGYNREGFDHRGYDSDGYNRTGYDRSGYDRFGYDRSGFDEQGIHRNGTDYGEDGYNRNGYDREGYDRLGYNRAGYDRKGYNKRGFDSDGVHRNGTRFDREGFDSAGYDGSGYGRSGYGRSGYDRQGYDRHGYDRHGYDRDGRDQYGRDRSGYDRSGYDRDGYDRSGHDGGGYDRSGYDGGGYDRSGRDGGGYDRDGYDMGGYNRDGYHRSGYHPYDD